MKKINLAIVGATGLVGGKIIELLEEYNINIGCLYLFASQRSLGKKIKFKNWDIAIEELCKKNIKSKKIDYAIFSAGADVSINFAPYFAKNGTIVIDNSSAYRLDVDVPLIVPEVNFTHNHKKNIIANPNCSTIECMLPLYIINKMYNIKTINYTTFQAVSGSGIKGINDYFASKYENVNLFYPYNIIDNCIPQIGNFEENGYSSEEMKMINETKKILQKDNLKVSATCVRVPILNSHAVSISVECTKKINVKNIIIEFSKNNSLIVLNDSKNMLYPIQSKANGQDKILVGRIRADLFNPKILHLYVVADNIRKGAGTNAVQILQKLIEYKK